MINIEICPAHSGVSGYYRARGHALKGHEDVCLAVTVITDCLAANLDICWDVKVLRRSQPGDSSLRWSPSKRRSSGIERANRAAGFAYNGLAALAKAWPDDLKVTWIKPEEIRRSPK